MDISKSTNIIWYNKWGLQILRKLKGITKSHKILLLCCDESRYYIFLILFQFILSYGGLANNSNCCENFMKFYCARRKALICFTKKCTTINVTIC